jgi:hypothetical protein
MPVTFNPPSNAQLGNDVQQLQGRVTEFNTAQTNLVNAFAALAPLIAARDAAAANLNSAADQLGSDAVAFHVTYTPGVP